jgi:hypothetical protein
MLLPTIISGLVLYFERSLGANLLYRFERPQLADVKKKYRTGQEVKPGQEKEVSAVYGAEHLLRLLGTFLSSPLNNKVSSTMHDNSQFAGKDCAIKLGS